MRIPSGVVDQYIYFVGVDSTDFTTRETGLTGFTVYRSRNGAAAAAMTTPTVNETDATNMPGVYELLLDEDMTIGSGNDSEEMVFHITATGMAPVTRTIELYRPKLTAGQTLTVTGGLASANTTQIEGADATDQINAACDTAMTDYGALQPTVAGRTLDVTTTGEAGLDYSNVNGTIGAASFAAGAIDANALATDAANEIRDAVMAAVVEDDGPSASNIALDDAIAFILAYAAGQATGQDTTSPIFKSPGGAENRIAGTTDGSGNRSAITLTAPT